jgi:zinc protease
MTLLSRTIVTPTRRLIAGVTLALLAGAAPVCAQATPTVRPLDYSRFVMKNGLVVLMNEDHSSPIVAVDVWYRVGAKNEGTGQMGFAHLCEHLMGEGSPNVSVPEKVLIQSIGGRSTFWANTTEDITHFYYTLPRNGLETALWLESDRMAAPLSRADSTHIRMVRETIRQERAQNREAPVFGLAGATTVAALFPQNGLLYGRDPLGPMSDLDSATPADVSSFCAPYYATNNAVLSLSGDFSSANTKTLIEKYFGGIKAGVDVLSDASYGSALRGSTRLVLEDSRAQTATLRLAWPSVGFDVPDRLALVALASLLSRDRLGVLSKLLVYDRGLATRVAAANFDFEHAGLFQIDVFPRPGASLSAIETLVDSALAAFSSRSIRQADLDAFKRANAVNAIKSLQTRAARADTLAHGEIFARDPVAYAKQVNATAALTRADIERVAREYLGANRIVMSMIPAGKLEMISKPELPYARVAPPALKP